MGTLAPEQAAPTAQYRAASALYNDGKYVEALSILQALRAQYPNDQTIAKAIQKCWSASEARDQVAAIHAAHPVKEEAESAPEDDGEPQAHPRVRFAIKVAVFAVLAAIPCVVIYTSIREALSQTGGTKPEGPTLQVIQSTVHTPGVGVQPVQRSSPVRTATPQRLPTAQQ